MRMQARDLAASRGGETLFENLSFDVSSSECLIVKGPNGSGKSTLIRTLAGLLPKDAGEVILSVEGVAQPNPAEACHYLGHRNAMKRELTVEENLIFWKRLFGDFDGGEGVSPQDAADQLGLGALLHLPFGYLSAGQQRRMAMARLLTAWRPVWLLDEPTASLDVQSEALFAGLMRAHLARGGLIIAATHQPLGLETVQEIELTGFVFREDAA
jgi:heme exporter protein A